jgi:hypothetical protein
VSDVLALGVAFVIGLMVLAAVFGLISLVFWVVLLPFKLLAFVFRGLGVLLLLPVLLVCGLGIGLLIGIPLILALALPLLPIVLLFAGIVWLAKRGIRSTAPTT